MGLRKVSEIVQDTGLANLMDQSLCHTELVAAIRQALPASLAANELSYTVTDDDVLEVRASFGMRRLLREILPTLQCTARVYGIRRVVVKVVGKPV